MLRGRARITIIGDGGNKSALIKGLDGANVTELVTLEPPVQREELIARYLSADVLFLHLNRQRAFEKVLPSKIFEYAALGKPILAGVAGYPADFLSDQVENVGVFPPGDAQAAVRAFEGLRLETAYRAGFIKGIQEDLFPNASPKTLLPWQRNRKKTSPSDKLVM